MDSLLVVDVEVPEHRRVRQVRLRVPLVGAIHRREFDRITNKESRNVIKNPIVVPLIGIELNRKSPDITHRIRSATLRTYG